MTPLAKSHNRFGGANVGGMNDSIYTSPKGSTESNTSSSAIGEVRALSLHSIPLAARTAVDEAVDGPKSIAGQWRCVGSLADSLFGRRGIVPERGIHFFEGFVVAGGYESFDNIIVEGRDIVLSESGWNGSDESSSKKEKGGGEEEFELHFEKRNG
ncbi:unnamed protein product [Tuber aestivum]|uniref:Uncharacterized protein n=1 Tax=Tuber aestivum TaxID=59557 RepID=A0A292PTB2_9PEZI|nr:unnamed protein product [Tuber aestivum]